MDLLSKKYTTDGINMEQCDGKHLYCGKMIQTQSIPRPHTHTLTPYRSSFLTSFISLPGTDLMIFPVKHKYILI